MKKLFLLFSIILFCSGCSTTGVVVEKSLEGYDKEYLQKRFIEYNNKYFEGKLTAECYWFDRDGLWGEYSRIWNYIFINHKLKDANFESTLLHEMCHASTRCEFWAHGPSFEKEVIRVAKLHGIRPYEVHRIDKFYLLN